MWPRGKVRRFTSATFPVEVERRPAEKSLRPAPSFPLIPPHEFEHFPVQLMALEIFVSHILATAVQHSKVASQIPHCEAPACFVPEREAIFHPGKRHRMRGFVVATPLAGVHLHAPVG